MKSGFTMIPKYFPIVTESAPNMKSVFTARPRLDIFPYCPHSRSVSYYYSLKIYTKTIIRLRFGDYGEYSPRRDEYSPVITSPSANNC
jgi:hypothetical protein